MPTPRMIIISENILTGDKNFKFLMQQNGKTTTPVKKMYNALYSSDSVPKMLIKFCEINVKYY